MYLALMIMAATVLRNQVLTNNQMILAIIFLANELRTSKKMAQRMVSHVRMAPEDVLEQGHLIN